MRAAIVSHRSSATNLALATRSWNGVQPELLSPREALLRLGRGDRALARLDVRDDLDRIEEGLWALERLVDCGVSILNRPPSLLRAHDKLLTTRTLRRAGLPHPRTTLIDPGQRLPDLDFPAVLKPRFGSWGKDVLLCRDPDELERGLASLSSRPWFHRSGALAQELIPPLGHDLRVIVARGVVVGAAKRVAAPGGWRTNVALGASVVRAVPPPVASRLALEAAAVSGLDLVGVDLLPTGPRRLLRARAERRGRLPPGLLVLRPERLRRHRRCADGRASRRARSRGRRRRPDLGGLDEIPSVPRAALLAPMRRPQSRPYVPVRALPASLPRNEHRTPATSAIPPNPPKLVSAC